MFRQGRKETSKPEHATSTNHQPVGTSSHASNIVVGGAATARSFNSGRGEARNSWLSSVSSSKVLISRTNLAQECTIIFPMKLRGLESGTGADGHKNVAYVVTKKQNKVWNFRMLDVACYVTGP